VFPPENFFFFLEGTQNFYDWDYLIREIIERKSITHPVKINTEINLELLKKIKRSEKSKT
jgi:hypothetical protein